MTIEHSCIICNASLIDKRSHAKTCSCRCRTALSRLSRAKPISIKLVLSKLQYNQLKADADDLGLLVNQLVIDRSITTFTIVGATV
jgi:hypothetical protein